MGSCGVPNIDILVLAILRGATEFLPVGSTGHLQVIPQLYCWPAQGPSLELAALLGALLAALLYFSVDLAGMLQSFMKLLQGKRDGRARVIGLLLVAAVPYLVAAYLLDRYVGDGWHSPVVVAYALAGFGLLLYGADKLGLTVRRVEHMTFGQAAMIGVVQCFAVIPGTGGTAITMTCGRLLGYERPDAVRFAFLLAIPILAVTGIYKGWLLFQAGGAIDWQGAGLMFGLSAVFGLLAIAFLMYWVRRGDFAPFALYRVCFALYLFYVLYRAGGLAC